MDADNTDIHQYMGLPSSYWGRYSPLSSPYNTPTSLPARHTSFSNWSIARTITIVRYRHRIPVRNGTFSLYRGRIIPGFASSSWGVFLHRLSPTAWEASAPCHAFGQPVCFCGCIVGFIDLVILPSLHLACLSAFDSADRGG